MSSRVVLRLTNVVKAFPGVVALKGVTFEVVEGEVHALVGENGAGKSTLMAVAAGATIANSGTVEIGGQGVGAPPPPRAPARGAAGGCLRPMCSSASMGRRAGPPPA